MEDAAQNAREWLEVVAKVSDLADRLVEKPKFAIVGAVVFGVIAVVSLAGIRPAGKPKPDEPETQIPPSIEPSQEDSTIE